MPYVPSEKTVPPAEDRKVLDPVIEDLAREVAGNITNNFSLINEYKRVFVETTANLAFLYGAERGGNKVAVSDKDPAAFKLAKAIYDVAKKYGYEGAHQGEFNYSFTRFIQRVPQIMVQEGKWEKKNELRYWLYASTVEALLYASRHTENFGIGVSGVFVDIKDEYKWKVNRSYEAAQIKKSGDCYDTPYYTRLVECVDENGKFVMYLDGLLERSDDTLNKDVLDYQIVLRKKSE